MGREFLTKLRGWGSRLFHEHRPHTRLDLLAPDLLTEVVIGVKPNGERTVFAGKHEGDLAAHVMVARSVIEAGVDLLRSVPLSQEDAVIVARGLAGVGMELGRQYGFQLNITHHPSQEGKPA